MGNRPLPSADDGTKIRKSWTDPPAAIDVLVTPAGRVAHVGGAAVSAGKVDVDVGAVVLGGSVVVGPSTEGSDDVEAGGAVVVMMTTGTVVAGLVVKALASGDSADGLVVPEVDPMDCPVEPPEQAALMTAITITAGRIFGRRSLVPIVFIVSSTYNGVVGRVVHRCIVGGEPDPEFHLAAGRCIDHRESIPDGGKRRLRPAGLQKRGDQD